MSVLRNKTFCCYSISKTEFTNLFQIKPIVHRDRGNKIVGGLQKKEKLALLYSTKYKEPTRGRTVIELIIMIFLFLILVVIFYPLRTLFYTCSCILFILF